MSKYLILRDCLHHRPLKLSLAPLKYVIGRWTRPGTTSVCIKGGGMLEWPWNLRSSKRLFLGLHYHRFIAGPTLNNSQKKLVFFWNLSLNVVEFFWIFLETITWCCWKCSKSWNFIIFLFLAKCKFSTLINYSINMCWTSYEPMVSIVMVQQILLWERQKRFFRCKC